jgi:hypothetical protein
MMNSEEVSRRVLDTFKSLTPYWGLFQSEEGTYYVVGAAITESVSHRVMV